MPGWFDFGHFAGATGSGVCCLDTADVKLHAEMIKAALVAKRTTNA